VSTLSGTYDTNAAGLPRGRTSLSAQETREQQQRRLVKAAITVFAEKGFAAATISDIVKYARVSRQVFYALFDSKEDCFLAADQLGRQALLSNVFAGLQQAGSSDQWVRQPIRAYLKLCVEEQEFTSAWAIEFPTAGARCLQQRHAFFSELAQLLKQGHSVIKAQQPQHWLPISDLFYQAAIGGAYETIFCCISQQRFADLSALENPLVDFIYTALGYRPQGESNTG
jgi:AcrR family transcriptional regulator